jgi:hypothetical protein
MVRGSQPDKWLLNAPRASKGLLMHHDLSGPYWGNVIVITLAGMITIACVVAMFWMLFRPGETDQHHAKYDILRDDWK